MMRWRISLLLFLGSLGGCTQRIAPITPGAEFTPAEREQRLWQASVETSRALQASARLHTDPALKRYCQAVLDRVIGDPAAYAPLTPRVFILDAPAVNAFTLPHGDIFIDTAILGRLRNEAQLAMLLGHEITHATHRHAHQELEHAYQHTTLSAYVGVLSGLAAMGVSQAVSLFGNLVTMSAISGYSREKETESDRASLQSFAQAGYDPREGPAMFRGMLAAADQSQTWNFFYATHPKMQARVDDCVSELAQLPADLRARATDIGTDRFVAAAGSLIRDEARRHILQGKYALALETLDFLAALQPAVAEISIGRGDLFRARGEKGDPQAARAAYEHALQLEPGAALAERGLALLSWQAGDRPSARTHFARYLGSAPTAPDSAWLDSLAAEEPIDPAEVAAP